MKPAIQRNLRNSIKTGIFCLSLFVFLHSAALKAQTLQKLSVTDPHLEYMGRIGFHDSVALLSWPGSSVAINFEGTDLVVRLKDDKGTNYYYAIVDDGEPVKLKPDTLLKDYTIASNLRKGYHNALLYKLTESRAGTTAFYGFLLNDNAALLPKATRKRKMEFYGNSITAGYSVDDTAGDSGAAEFANNYFSYAAITARHYKARYSCIAKSGIGLMVSWGKLIMPEMYDRPAEDDSTGKWDFREYQPDIVVINLGQNDCMLVSKKDHPQFKARFGYYPPDEKYIILCYKEFIKNISSKYPDAAIICALGSMNATKPGSPWPGYIEKAVKSLNDKNIYTHFFPYNNTNKHPKRDGQIMMANDLIRFIDTHIKW